MAFTPLVHPDAIKMAVRQIKRWIFAAKQDRHPGIAFLHASYAVGDLDMLRQVVSDNVVIDVTRINPFELHKEATQLQDEAQDKMESMCPRLK